MTTEQGGDEDKADKSYAGWTKKWHLFGI